MGLELVTKFIASGLISAREMSTKIAMKIENIRYGECGTILFDIGNKVECIPEPMDVLLVESNKRLAATYIARKHFSQLAKYSVE